MSSIKEQVLAQQQGQYSESDDKYLSVLKQYNCDLNDEEVAAEVKKILDEKVAENETMEVKKFLFGSIELTSLHTEDTEESILAMIEKVNQFAKDYPELPFEGFERRYKAFVSPFKALGWTYKAL